MPVGIPGVTDALCGFLCDAEINRTFLLIPNRLFLRSIPLEKGHVGTVETVNACRYTTKCRKQQPVALLHVHDSNRCECMRFHVSF